MLVNLLSNALLWRGGGGRKRCSQQQGAMGHPHPSYPGWGHPRIPWGGWRHWGSTANSQSRVPVGVSAALMLFFF